MRRFPPTVFVTVLALAVGFSGNAQAQPNPGGGVIISAKDDEACYRLLSKQLEAWNSGDVEALVADLAEDVSVIDASGFATHSRGDYAKRQAELFKSTPKAVRKREDKGPYLKAVGPAGAVLTVVHEVTTDSKAEEKGGQGKGGARFYSTYVLEKKGGRWWIASVQETAINEAPAAK